MSLADVAFLSHQALALILVGAAVCTFTSRDWPVALLFVALAVLISSDGFEDYRRWKAEAETGCA